MDRHGLDVGGQRRHYLLAEPEQRPTRLVLSLYGTRSSAAGQARLSRLISAARRTAAVVVFPQALQPIGRGFEWSLDADCDYLSLLIDGLRERYAIAARDVTLSGMSGGARMSCHFASIRPEAVRLVVAVAGLRGPSAPDPVTPGSRPVRIQAFHGTADRINPYDGSGTTRWNESVPEAARRWACANNVDPNPTTVDVSKHVTRTTYGEADAADAVTLWTVRGGGHTWPGTPLGPLLRLMLGPTTDEVDATAHIIDDPGR